MIKQVLTKFSFILSMYQEDPNHPSISSLKGCKPRPFLYNIGERRQSRNRQSRYTAPSPIRCLHTGNPPLFAPKRFAFFGCSKAADLDIAGVMGMGFPPYRFVLNIFEFVTSKPCKIHMEGLLLNQGRRKRKIRCDLSNT